LAQRACAALRALALRWSAVSFLARAFPPILANSERVSFFSFAILLTVSHKTIRAGKHSTSGALRGITPLTNQWGVQYKPDEEIRAYGLKNRERWIEICAQAAEELDPVKLLTLTQEITRLLEEKQQRLERGRKSLRDF
jgi:hypothetical protein